MKIRIVGGPVEGRVEVETAASANFATIMVLAEGLIGKGTLHDKYQFYKCEVVDKKAKAVAPLSPNDTPTTAQLPATGALVMLKAISGSPVGTPRDAPSSAAAAATPASESTTASTAAKATGKKLTYRERIVAMYEAYDPSKVGSVEGTLEKYKGKEDAVLKKLVEKYGPEPGVRADDEGTSAHTAAATAGASASQPTSSSAASATRTPRERIVALYQKYDPSKISTVDSVIEKFKGKEDAVIRKLVEKYGPEPLAEASTASTPASVVAPSTPAQPPQPSIAQPVQPSTSVVDKSPAAAVAEKATNEKSIRDRIVALYQHYDPSKVDTVDATLEKYKGKEEAVLKKVIEKYGPEVESQQPPSRTPPPAAPPAKPAAAPPVTDTTNAPQPEQPIRGRGQSVVQTPAAAVTTAPPQQNTSSDARARTQSVVKTTSASEAPPRQPQGPTPSASVPVTQPLDAAPSHDEGEDDESRAPPTTAPPKPASVQSSSSPRPASPPPPPSAPAHQTQPVVPDAGAAPAGKSVPVTTGSPSSLLQQEPASRFKGMDPRFVSLVASVMQRAWEEANHHVMRHRFEVWRQHALEQAAERLVSDGVWQLDKDGKQYVHTESQYKTKSLITFLQQQGTARSQVLSKAMSHVLRKLIHSTNALSSEPSTARLPVAFHDDDNTVALLNEAVAQLEESAAARSELARVRDQHLSVSQELASSKEQLQQATAQLAALEPLVGTCQSLERELSATKSALDQSQSAAEKLDSQLKAVLAEFEKTQKELQKERRGLPTDMEAVIKVKDERIAYLEQQLAKSRLKLKGESTSQQRLIERIRELESDVCLLERSREVVGFVRRQSVPATSPSPRLLRRSTESESTPRTGRAPPPITVASSGVPPLQTNLISHRSSEPEVEVAGHDDSQRFDTSPRRPPISVVVHPNSAREKELAELALKSEILQHELQQENPRAKRDNAGNCPHCDTRLTALRHSSDGGDSTDAVCERAFCFSCRRSFTTQDLHRFAASARASVRNKAKH